MNKNKDYFEFVEYIKKEVQNVIKDWEAEAVYQPAEGPETDDCLLVKMPTEEAIKKILKDVKAEKLTPYVDKVSDEPLMKEAPKGGMYATSSTTNPYRVLKTNMPSSTR